MHTNKRLLWKHAICDIAILLLLSASAGFGEEAPGKAVSPSRILFTGQSPTLGAIKLKLQFYGVGQAKPAPAVREWGWGCGVPVDVAIGSLELWLGKTRVEVPAKTYANLLNITPITVTFRETQGKLFLYMSGGDGAETYETQIEIARGAIRRRETVGGEFKYPQPPYERITFKPDGTSAYSLETGIPRQLSKPRGSKIQLAHEESG
jgi:hypothetical protein